MAERDNRGTRMAAYVSLAIVSEHLPRSHTASMSELERLCGIPRSTIRTHLVEVIPDHHGFAVVEKSDDSRNDEWRLTPAGRELAFRSRLLLRTAETVDTFKPQTKGVLRIGGFNAGFRTVIAERLKKLRCTSNVELIELHPRNQIAENVLSGAVDVAIDWVGEGEEHPAEKDPYLQTRRDSKLCELVAVANAQSVPDFLGKQNVTSLASVAVHDTPLILTRTDAAEFLKGKQLAEDLRYISCHTIGAAIALIEREVGVGVLWDIGDLLNRPDFLVLRFQTPLRRRIQLITIWREDNYKWRKEVIGDALIQIIDGQ